VRTGQFVYFCTHLASSSHQVCVQHAWIRKYPQRRRHVPQQVWSGQAKNVGNKPLGVLTTIITDYIDLFVGPLSQLIPAAATDSALPSQLIHDPYSGTERRLATYKALLEAKAAGKIRSVGVSNYGVHHLEELKAAKFEMPAVNQIEVKCKAADLYHSDAYDWYSCTRCASKSPSWNIARRTISWCRRIARFCVVKWTSTLLPKLPQR
jgi:hypothetical protein